MASFTQIPFHKLIHNVIASFQGVMQEDGTNQREENKQEIGDNDQKKFQVSKQDLKLISSALLFYKKSLLKQNNLEKARKVMDIDNQIYNLIVELDGKQTEDV